MRWVVFAWFTVLGLTALVVWMSQHERNKNQNPACWVEGARRT